MRRTGFAALVGLVVCAGIAPAGAVVLSDGASDADSKALANSFAYSSVGQLINSTSTSYASAVMIAPGWLLTAGHVTQGASNLFFFADAGGLSSGRGGGIAADAYYTNPSWNPANIGDGYDIGLIHLSSNPGCLAAATCQTATLYGGAADLGNVATMVGYGLTGTGTSGAQQASFDGLKRAGSNTVDVQTGPGNNIFLADFDNGDAANNTLGNPPFNSSSSTPVTNEALIAPGDSGGGLFEIIGGVEYLVGIASFIASNDGNSNSDYGDVGGWTRVSDFVSWIDSTIAANSPVSVPEPAGAALLGAGLLTLGFLRRRKDR